MGFLESIATANAYNDLDSESVERYQKARESYNNLNKRNGTDPKK